MEPPCNDSGGYNVQPPAGPPLGMNGRRAGDLSAHVGVALEPNMDQSDIDMLLKPQRVAL